MSDGLCVSCSLAGGEGEHSRPGPGAGMPRLGCRCGRGEVGGCLQGWPSTQGVWEALSKFSKAVQALASFLNQQRSRQGSSSLCKGHHAQEWELWKQSGLGSLTEMDFSSKLWVRLALSKSLSLWTLVPTPLKWE